MKKLDDLQQLGFIINKKYQTAYGNIGGYKYFVNFLGQSGQYTIVTTVKKEEDAGELEKYIDTMDRGPFLNYITYKDRVLYISMKNNNQLDVWELDRIMKNVSNFLQAQGYVQCCRHCGQVVDVDVCSVEGHADLICSNCFNNYEGTMPEVKPVNLPLGIIGALLGSLVGVIAWVLIYKLGIIAGISGFIMSMGCLKGYEMLGGRLDKKGIIIGIIIAIAMLFTAEMISLVLEIQSAVGTIYEIGFIEALQTVPYFLEEGEVMGAVIQDLVIGYLFMAAASFTYIRNQYKAVSVENVMERM